MSSSPSGPAWSSPYSVRLVLDNRLTAGALLVFILYLGKMYKPMKDLSKMTDTLSKAAVSFERMGEILSLDCAVSDCPGARPAPALKGRMSSHTSGSATHLIAWCSPM